MQEAAGCGHDRTVQDTVAVNTDLRSDCASCVGLCCAALPFSRSADFPEDKAAGVPCRNLRADYGCAIHARLAQQGWIGCTVFECFGAGQRVTQSFGGRQAQLSVETKRAMYAVFPLVQQLHEMLWYLNDPVVTASGHAAAAREQATQINDLAAGTPEELRGIDVPAIRSRTGSLLTRVSAEARKGRANARLPRQVRPGGDLAGAGLRGAKLGGCSLRGALLIGADLRFVDLSWADLLGADLRGADVRGADLRTALFLTQPQANAALGDNATLLPAHVERPAHWV